MICLNSAGWVANTVDPDQILHSVSTLSVQGNYGNLMAYSPNIDTDQPAHPPSLTILY